MVPTRILTSSKFLSQKLLRLPIFMSQNLVFFMLSCWHVFSFMYLGLQVSICLTSDTWFSCTLDYKFQLVWSLILHFHVPWITSFYLFGFLYFAVQVLKLTQFLNVLSDVYSIENINLPWLGSFHFVSWLFTKSNSADYNQILCFFSNSTEY